MTLEARRSSTRHRAGREVIKFKTRRKDWYVVDHRGTIAVWGVTQRKAESVVAEMGK